jgi:hypothetical protein
MITTRSSRTSKKANTISMMKSGMLSAKKLKTSLANLSPLLNADSRLKKLYNIVGLNTGLRKMLRVVILRN